MRRGGMNFGDRLVQAAATGLYTGYAPVSGGTVGSIPPALISALLVRDNLAVALAIALICPIVSVWLSGAAEKFLGHDSKKIVIDEWAGWFVTILFIPVTWRNILIAFVAFRFFDVVKPWPGRRLEQLPGGWGITLDDISAGIQANVVAHLIIYALDHLV
jgi:phosphatidylglycerophosphatase A